MSDDIVDFLMSKHDAKFDRAADTIAMLRAALKMSQETIDELRKPDHRVVEFFWNHGIGAGEDPVKTLMAAYTLLTHQRDQLLVKIEELQEEIKFLSEENNDLVDAYDRMARNVP